MASVSLRLAQNRRVTAWTRDRGPPRLWARLLKIKARSRCRAGQTRCAQGPVGLSGSTNPRRSPAPALNGTGPGTTSQLGSRTPSNPTSWTTVSRRSSISERTPSLHIRLDRLSSTARGVIWSELAISLFGRPSLINSRTSRSLSVSRSNLVPASREWRSGRGARCRS